MKIRLATLLCFAAASPLLPAQEPVPVTTAPAPVPAPRPTLPAAGPAPISTATTSTPNATDPAAFTAEQLEQLLGPIALYPDALIALMLPAATSPADLVLAARYLGSDGDPAAAAGRAWDESVKSLVHYPEVVKWMDANLDWTKQVGEAFRLQSAEVMDAIQRLRARARAAGTLIDSPQQQVHVEGNVIAVVPTEPDVIYVPYYDPAVVYYAPAPGYYDSYGSRSFVTFSAPFAAGAWLAFDCDWRRRTVWTADRHWAPRHQRDWRYPSFPGHPGYVDDPRRHPWRPSPNLPRLAPVTTYTRTGIVRPAPIAALPRPPAPSDNPSYRRNDGRRPDSNYNRAFTPGSGPALSPAPRETTTPPQTSPAPTAPTTVTPPSSPAPDRRGGNTDRGRNPNYNSNDRPNRSSAGQTPPSAPAPASVVGPVAPPSRHNANPPPPPLTGQTSLRVNAPAPQSAPPPAARAAPPPPSVRAAPPAAPATQTQQPAPPPDDRRRNRDREDQNKQPN